MFSLFEFVLFFFYADSFTGISTCLRHTNLDVVESDTGRRSQSPSTSEPRRRRKSRSKSSQHHSKGNVGIEQDKLSRILLSVEGMQNKFAALSERMTTMESRFCQQANPHASVEEKSMDDDRLSTAAGPPLDENECLDNAETSSANCLRSSH